MSASEGSGFITTEILPESGYVTTEILPANDSISAKDILGSTHTTPFQRRKIDKAIKKVLGGRLTPKDTSLDMVAKQIYMEDTYKAIKEFYADVLLDQDDLGANSIRIYTRNLESLTKVCTVLRNLETTVGRFTGVRVNFATRAGVWKKGLNLLLRFDTVAEAFRAIAHVLALDSGFKTQTVIPARLRALYGIAKCGTKTDKDPSEIPKTLTTDERGMANSAGDSPKKETSGEAEGQDEGKSDYLATIDRFKKPKGKGLNRNAASYVPSVNGQSVAFEDDYEYRIVENMMRDSGELDRYYRGDYYRRSSYGQAFGREAYCDTYGYQYYDYHRRQTNYEFSGESSKHSCAEEYSDAKENRPAFEKSDPAKESSKGSGEAAKADKGDWKTTISDTIFTISAAHNTSPFTF